MKLILYICITLRHIITKSNITVLFMNRKNSIPAFSLMLSLLISGCTQENIQDNLTNGLSKELEIEGNVEKGPFISGSEISLQPLNADLSPVGTSYKTTITDNKGSFKYKKITFPSSYAEMVSTGYFFNEVTGELSTGMITLKSLVNIDRKSSVNVNILTHLKYSRISNLIDNGKTFEEADKLAQKEVLYAFGLQRFADTDFIKASISDGTDQAASLIAIASLLLVDRTEAEFTEHITTLCREFATKGTLSEETKLIIQNDIKKVNDILENGIGPNIINRYEQLNQEISLKNLALYFDWNNDGIAGNEILNEDESVVLEKTELKVPSSGGTYLIKIASNIPLTLKRDNEPDSIVGSTINLYTEANIDCTASLINGDLHIDIKPCNVKIMKPHNIRIFDYRGNILATLKLEQEGSASGSIFSDEGKQMIASCLSGNARDYDKFVWMDNRYCAKKQEELFTPYFTAPLSTNNRELQDCWRNSWKTVYSLNKVIDLDKKSSLKILIPYLSTLRSLMYYNLSTYWGQTTYRTEDNFNQFYVPWISANKALEILETELTDIIPQLEEKKNNFNDAGDMIQFSKDVPRFILANICMSRGNYNKASDILKAIVANGFYSLDTNTPASADSPEVIFMLSANNNNHHYLTYTEVLLGLAECSYHLGLNSQGDSYLEQIINKKGLSVSERGISGLKLVRSQALKHRGDYLNFLKRNNIAISELGLQQYQLIYPIPQNEIGTGSEVVQNPGY